MDNLIKIFNQANSYEVEKGLTWYSDVNQTLIELAKKYGVKPEIAHAVCSALSPRCIWNQNLIDTEKVLRWYKDKKSLKQGIVNKTLPSVTTYKRNLKKAIDILKTGNVEVFKTCKTFNFFKNISEPFNNDYVTVDGHAINAYYNKLGIVENKHFTPKYYNEIATKYKKGAKKFNILACQFQAIIWLTFKRIHNIKVNWREYQTNLPF